MSNFRIVPLTETVAAQVRRTRDDGHGNVGLEPLRAGPQGGFPCRACLRDAAPGEEMLLFSYTPWAEARPYRAVGPIFIHARACEAPRRADAVPEYLRSRLLSLRAYDARDAMVDADVTEGSALEVLVERLFARADVRYIDVHHARPGCFACRVERP